MGELFISDETEILSSRGSPVQPEEMESVTPDYQVHWGPDKNAAKAVVLFLAKYAQGHVHMRSLATVQAGAVQEAARSGILAHPYALEKVSDWWNDAGDPDLEDARLEAKVIYRDVATVLQTLMKEDCVIRAVRSLPIRKGVGPRLQPRYEDGYFMAVGIDPASLKIKDHWGVLAPLVYPLQMYLQLHASHQKVALESRRILQGLVWWRRNNPDVCRNMILWGSPRTLEAGFLAILDQMVHENTVMVSYGPRGTMYYIKRTWFHYCPEVDFLRVLDDAIEKIEYCRRNDNKWHNELLDPLQKALDVVNYILLAEIQGASPVTLAHINNVKAMNSSNPFAESAKCALTEAILGRMNEHTMCVLGECIDKRKPPPVHMLIDVNYKSPCVRGTFGLSQGSPITKREQQQQRQQQHQQRQQPLVARPSRGSPMPEVQCLSDEGDYSDLDDTGFEQLSVDNRSRSTSWKRASRFVDPCQNPQ